MRSAFGREVLALLLFGICLGCDAQTPAQPKAATGDASETVETSHADPVPRVPGVTSLFRGFNAGLSFAQVHDSAAGWYNLVTPAVSYRISPRYSLDASVSLYPYRRVQKQSSQNPQQTQLEVHHGDVGDALIGAHATFDLPFARNTVTGAFTVPTGNRAGGLGTGRVTFDLSDHLEHSIRQVGLLLDLGGGDSSSLFNRIVSNNQNSLGPLVHFQSGIVVYLPWSSHIASVAYEQLPLGSQKVFATVGSPGTPVSQVVSGGGISEDNGITTSTGIPITDHLTLAGYYNRSLRQPTDTVSFGVTYVVRGTPRKMSLIDRALREAAGAGN